MTFEVRIGIDIGGTFTDAFAISAEGIITAKVPSNKDNPGAAVLNALDQLGLKDTPARFLHGTTLVTNMLLERKGAKTGFITGEGMRDIVHIGRHERPLTYAIKQDIPHQSDPPAPRKWRLTVPERISADGEVITELQEEPVRAAARRLAQAGVEAIAIGFLHSYRFPDHESRAIAWVQDEAPDAFVCTSSEVSPRFREYERYLTAIWNARVAPGAARYLADLAFELEKRWPGLPLTLMTSNGGLEKADLQSEEIYGDLRRTPIRLALSGPAAAGNAVARVIQDLGLADCVGLDVGGTSSDIVVVRNGRLGEAPWEDRRVGGYPLQIPMLDLHTIGAGGGSLVFRDEFGILHVGPQSAGAVPGPACYNLGGTRPTVTDAAVVTGRLPAAILLGGTMPIRRDLAWGAFTSTFSAEESDPVSTALNVLALAEANIAFGIRERTVSRGLDPGKLALVAAGGAGPLLACGVAEILELAEVIIPPRPGLLAAWGLLVAPDRRESIITVLRPLNQMASEQSKACFDRAFDALSAPPPAGAHLLRTAALRYLGQGFEVEISVDEPSDISEIARRFHAAHEDEYGFSMPQSTVEWVELRVAWELAAERWEFPQPDGGRRSDFQEADIWEMRADPDSSPRSVKSKARLYIREALAAGDEMDGPAIVMEEDATTYIPGGWKANVTEDGYLRIKRYEQR